MQQRRHAARMALARRAGEHHVAGEGGTGGIQCLGGADHGRDAGEIVGDAPAVQPAVGDGAGERVVAPGLEVGVTLAVGVGEEDHRAAAAGAAPARDDAAPLAFVDRVMARELGDHRHVAGAVGMRLDLPPQCGEAVGEQALAGLLPVPAGGDQCAQEGDAGGGRVAHIMILAWRRSSSRSTENAV